MDLSNAAKRRLGNLAAHAGRSVAEMIKERGGNASDVRQAGPWSSKTLGETAESAAKGDAAAATAIKIVKQAKRLGEQH
jgi:hypothetical protein